MKLPKYEFFIGEAKDANFIKENGAYISGRIPIEHTQKILVNKRYTGFDVIKFYDENGKYLSNKRLILLEGVMIDVPAKAKAFDASLKEVNDLKQNEIIYVLTKVTPHYKTMSKKLSRENDQEFFRTTLDGKISLVGDDFEVISRAGIETQFVFLIYKRDNDKWFEYFKGRFAKTDCKFDLSKKVCELKLTAEDEYSAVMDGYEKSFNIVKLTPEIERISLYKRPLIQVYIKGASTIANFVGGTYWESDVDEAVDKEEDLLKKYHFAYNKSFNEFNPTGFGSMTESEVKEFKMAFVGTKLKYYSEDGKYYLNISFLGNIGAASYYGMFMYRTSDDELLYWSAPNYSVNSGDILDPAEIGKGYIEYGPDKWLLYAADGSGKTITFEGLVYHTYQRLLCDVESYQSGDTTVNTFPVPIDDFVSDNRNYKRCVDFLGGNVVCSAKSVEEATRFGINDYGRYFTDNFTIPYGGFNRPMPVSSSYWGNSGIWFFYGEDYAYPIFEEKVRKKYTLKNAYSVASMIKAILAKIDPTIKHEATEDYSQFLYSENAPLPNMDRFYVYLTPKSNMLKGDYDQAAQKGDISLKGIMDMLWKCFRCLWFIDNGKLRIEHISYFYKGRDYSDSEGTVQLDFTKEKDLFNRKNADFFQSEIEYNKSDLGASYTFKWMDTCTEPFNEATIDIQSNYVQKDKTEEVTVDQFSPDVDYMLLNPGDFSSDGFALLCPLRSTTGEYKLPIVYLQGLYDESGNKYDVYVQNGCASWPYLLSRFHIYNLPAAKVKCDIFPISARSIMRSMSHTIKGPLKNDINPLELVRTNIGLGTVENVSVNIDTRMTTIELSYIPK